MKSPLASQPSTEAPELRHFSRATLAELGCSHWCLEGAGPQPLGNGSSPISLRAARLFSDGGFWASSSSSFTWEY